MRLVISSFILVVIFQVFGVQEHSLLGILFARHAFAQEGRNRTATLNQVVVGEMKKEGGDRVMVNRTPCGDFEKIVTFNGNFEIEKVGQRRCKTSGKTYEAIRVTQH